MMRKNVPKCGCDDRFQVNTFHNEKQTYCFNCNDK